VAARYRLRVSRREKLEQQLVLLEEEFKTLVIAEIEKLSSQSRYASRYLARRIDRMAMSHFFSSPEIDALDRLERDVRQLREQLGYDSAGDVVCVIDELHAEIWERGDRFEGGRMAAYRAALDRLRGL
jgi:hypothetical protein